MKFPAARLIVFAKAPTPGQVKTRLMPQLTAEQAATLHKQLVEQTLATAVQAKLAPVELWCAPRTDHPFFQRCREQFGVALESQQGSGLGERMHHAFLSTLRHCSATVLVGSDVPDLSQEYLHDAFAALHENSDAVLGPAEDGGYFLLGLRRPSAELFNGMRWSVPTVLNDTRTRLKKLGWQWQELATLRDVDRPEDLTAWAGFSPAREVG